MGVLAITWLALRYLELNGYPEWVEAAVLFGIPLLFLVIIMCGASFLNVQKPAWAWQRVLLVSLCVLLILPIPWTDHS